MPTERAEELTGDEASPTGLLAGVMGREGNSPTPLQKNFSLATVLAAQAILLNLETRSFDVVL